jgi:hypothetical protein
MKNSKVLLEIVHYCAEEVERQGRGPTQVWWMVEAWIEAIAIRNAEYIHAPRQNDLLRCAWLIEREKNIENSWRCCDVRVGSRLCPPWPEVQELMNKFFERLPDMTPAEAYKEFLLIHPLQDGNGRIGKILFNWLGVSLAHPKMPPNFFNCANP